MFLFRKRPRQLTVYCDGGIGDDGRGTGLGVVIRDERNGIVGLVKQGLPPMTNNEAEYAALVLALQTVQRQFRPRKLQVFMDSEVVVGQMIGRFSVRSAGLKQWHSRACRLARGFKEISYHHIPRDANRLADALANEALVEWVASRD